MLTNDKEFMDIDLSVTAKQRFRIDGDNNRILELNTSDMGIISRLNDTLPKLNALAEKASEIKADEIVDEDTMSAEQLNNIANTIKEMDEQLREYMDYIFDSNVSEVCAPSGTMYDIFDGQFRYLHILDKLTKLYEDNIESEYSKVKQRMAMHTDKYIKKSKKKK